MKAYVVAESWNNGCRDHDFYTDEDRTIGVFSSMEKAKTAVDKRIAEQVNVVKTKDPSTEVTFSTANDDPRLYFYRGVCFEYSDSDSPFGHFYTFDRDNFDYFIKDFELDELEEG